MQSNPAPSAPTPRWYGNATSPYTPLGTTSTPRCGGQNDTADISPGIIGVILQDGTVVQVNIEDYELLRARGWTARWTARWVTGDNQYPSINHGDRIRVVARVILDARKGEIVRYKNGDRNDLTRGNLILRAKGGIDIGSSKRLCLEAPVLGSAERSRSFAVVAAAVGTASMGDRLAGCTASGRTGSTIRAGSPSSYGRKGHMKRDTFNPATALQSRAPDLTTLAHRLLIEMLEGHRNGVSEDHSLALWQLLSGFTEQGLHIRNRRIAYALPCGSGKTLSVVAWIAAQYQLGLGLSVAVSAQQIASLCVIKEALIKAGVPETMIGIRHSHGSAAQYPDTGEDDRSIMLGSHSRIRGNDEIPAFCLYKGTMRDLLIWDETLLSTDATTLLLSDANTALMHVAKEGKCQFLQLASSRLQTATQAERAIQRTGPPTLLTLLTPEESDAALVELGHPVFGSHLNSVSHEAARNALKLMRHPVSLLDAGNGRNDVVLMRYQVAIAPELTNIAVLDASYVVSELCKVDPTIRDGTTEMMRSFKRYSDVRVKQTMAPTGRSSFNRSMAERVEAVQACIGSILSAPRNERILVITYKEEGRKGGDLIGLLKDELARTGIDPDALLPDGSRRVSFTTWGKHTTDNSFSGCHHVVLLGVLRMSLSSLAAAVAGQRRDECFRLSKKELLTIELSELASNIMQAMNRGTCRRVDVKGNAMSMALHLHTKERGLQLLLQAAMPGLQWETIEVKAPTKTEEATLQIVEHLLTYPAGEAKVSKQRLFSDLGITLGKDAKAEAMAEAMTKLREHAWHRFEFSWAEEGRSLFRRATEETAVEFQPSVRQAQSWKIRESGST